jgi:type IV secretion system protein VirD4
MLTVSTGSSQHLQGRPLLTPDEIMRLPRDQVIVLVAGERPHLLDRLNYFADAGYAGRFDRNPLHG